MDGLRCSPDYLMKFPGNRVIKIQRFWKLQVALQLLNNPRLPQHA